jgi:hypothetical protein
MRERRFNRGLVLIVAIIVGMLILGVIAIILIYRDRTVNVRIVPDDYATIQAAINAAAPGDTIQVRPGTYNENIQLNKAVILTAEVIDQVNPINNRTIIDGTGNEETILIPNGLTALPIVRGFIIQNSIDGIRANSPFIAEFNFFRTVLIPVNYQMGSGGRNGSNVYFNSGDDAIQLDNISQSLVIENNRILYSEGDGIEINLQSDTVPPAPVQVDIWNNLIIGSAEDGIQFVDFASEVQDVNRRFVIAGNLIANNVKAGIGLMPNANTVEDYSGADTVEPIRIFNNTIFGNDYGISGGDNLVVFNSIIANSRTRGAWRVQGPAGSNSVIAHTLFHGNILDFEQSDLGVGNIIGQDPLFQSAPNPGPDGTWETFDDDFSGLLLQQGSPAIDRGVPQFITANGEAVPPIPLTGFAGAAPDLGWREFGSAMFITPTATPISSPTPTATLTLTPLTPSPSATVVTSTPITPSATLPFTPTVPTPTMPTATQPPTNTPPPAPVRIAGINPIAAQVNTTVTMTITGTGFVPGAIVTFEGAVGTPPEVTTVQVLNATTIQATVNVRSDPAPQVWDLRVTNPDQTSAILHAAFTVNP